MASAIASFGESAHQKSVFDPLDPRSVATRVGHEDDVESRTHARKVVPLLQQPAGRTEQPLSLPCVDTCRRPSIGIRRASAHLDDGQLAVTELRDDIELPAAAAVIPQQDASSLRLQIRCGGLFSQPADLLPVRKKRLPLRNHDPGELGSGVTSPP